MGNVDKWRNAAAALRNKKTTENSETDEFVKAVMELHDFLTSDEGLAAIDLLAAWGKSLVLAKDDEESTAVVVYILGPTGLVISYETGGISAAYSTKDQRPRLEKASEVDIVKAVAEYGHVRPSEIVSFINEQMDLLADEALGKS